MEYQQVFSPWHMKLDSTTKTITIDLYPDIVEHPGVEKNFEHLFELIREYCVPKITEIFKKEA